MVQTISIPDANEQLQIACNKRARGSFNTVLPENQKHACVLLRLAPAVTPANYPALKTAVEAIPGIQSVELMMDGHIPASLPEDTEIRLYVDGQWRLENSVG